MRTEGYKRQVNFLVLFSGMAGALGLARAVVDEGPSPSDSAGGQEVYIKSFWG
jgi:hypothetical protein